MISVVMAMLSLGGGGEFRAPAPLAVTLRVALEREELAGMLSSIPKWKVGHVHFRDDLIGSWMQVEDGSHVRVIGL